MRRSYFPKHRLSKSLIAALLAVSTCGPVALGQSTSQGGFDDAWKALQTYVIQTNDVDSIHKGLEQLRNLIAQYPNEPEIYQAKLQFLKKMSNVCFASALSPREKRDLLVEASALAESLAKDATTQSKAGREYIAAYAEFEIDPARGERFRNLDQAEKLVRDLEAWGKGEDNKATVFQAWGLLADIKLERRDNIGVVKDIIGYYKETESWGDFWGKLWNEDRDMYRELAARNSRIVSVLGGAVISCDDPAILEMVKNAHLNLRYEAVQRAVDMWPIYHPGKIPPEKVPPPVVASPEELAAIARTSAPPPVAQPKPVVVPGPTIAPASAPVAVKPPPVVIPPILATPSRSNWPVVAVSAFLALAIVICAGLILRRLRSK